MASQFLDVHSWKAATTTFFFNIAQETDSSELNMERCQAMLAGMVIFLFMVFCEGSIVHVIQCGDADSRYRVETDDRGPVSLITTTCMHRGCTLILN